MYPPAVGGTGGGGVRVPYLGNLNSSGVKPPAPPSVFSAYSGSIPQTASDYDSIMQGYRGLSSGAGPAATAPITPGSYNPVQNTFGTTKDVTGSISNLRDLASTGGYSPSDIAAIRERGISPIRSIYASAQRNLDRSRALQGGYSPGYAAAQVRMARDLSNKISDQTTNVNAQVAQMVAEGKQRAAPELASAAAGEEGRLGQVAAENVAATNRGQEFNIGTGLSAEEFNRQLASGDWANRLRAIQGMQSLYGTTPALAATFGQQALGAAGLAENQRQFDTNYNLTAPTYGLGTVGSLVRGGYR